MSLPPLRSRIIGFLASFQVPVTISEMLEESPGRLLSIETYESLGLELEAMIKDGIVERYPDYLPEPPGRGMGYEDGFLYLH